MGHIRLGNLPQTLKWRQLIALLESGADDESLAKATLDAASRRLAGAGSDDALVHAFWLLTQIPLAARKPDLPQALRDLGLPVSSPPSVLAVACGLADAVDANATTSGHRSDLAEMALLSASESITTLGTRKAGALFGTTPEDVRHALAELSTKKWFGLLTREFVARFLTRFLAYHLGRETSNYVGPEKKFGNLTEHAAFYDALQLHCRQASLIVQDFAGGWFTKAEYETGITPERASRFLHHAFTKVRRELNRGGPAS